jgi:hydroxymethylpyrimidine pyrophosphatase-like HAD family hydrolase
MIAMHEEAADGHVTAPPLPWKALIDLFVFDLDGTALGGEEPYARLPDRFSEFLDELAGQGVRWGINTTWHPSGQDDMLQRSAVRSRPAFLWGRTGLLRGLYEAKGGRFVFDRESERSADALVPAFRTAVAQVVQRLNAERDLSGQVCVTDVDDEPLLVTVAIDAGQRAEVTRRLADWLEPDSLAVINPDTGGPLLICPRMMNKATSLRRMQMDLGVAPSRTLVAADGWNDLPMLDPCLASFQICPSNAVAEVKQRVLAAGGCVGAAPYASGVLAAAAELLNKSLSVK